MRLDQERIEIAQEVLEEIGQERTLNRVQARSFVRCLQATWDVEQIYWGKKESANVLSDAMRLVHAGRIFTDVEGSSSVNAQRSYRRVGELLEWLSRVDDPIRNVAPTLLLASAAYQLGGLPAMASGLLKQANFRSSGEKLYGLFLGADFNGVINEAAKFWKTNFDLTKQDYKQELIASEKGFDFPWYITVELVRSLGLIADCLRRGIGERLELGIAQLKVLELSALRGASPESSLLISLLREVAQSFREKSIYGPVMKMLEFSPDKHDVLKSIARGQYHNGRGVLWSSQIVGLDRLLAQSSFAMCTPTGSGKTLVANLSLVKELLLRDHGLVVPLALYIVPSRALAGEVEAKLSREMKNEFIVTGLYGGTDWGITDAWLTADKPTVLVATVEKADALLRYLGPFILPRLKLLIIDEAHQVVPVNSDFVKTGFAEHSERSIRLESLVSRLLERKPDMARIALTAVAGGAAGPVARWIEQRQDAVPVGLNYRSTRQLIGILRTRSERSAKIQIDLMNGTQLRVEDFDGKREAVYINLRTPQMPTLPRTWRDSLNRFNQTDILWTALHLKTEKRRVLISLAQQPEQTMGWFTQALALPEWAEVAHFTPPELENELALYDEALAACEDYCGENAYEGILLKHGIATSYGQMPQRLRRLMTELIDRGICPVTVATATLTEGVNLPFDIIFVPQLKRRFYDSISKTSKVTLMNTSEFNNLSGRAGRAGASKGMEGITLVAIPLRPSATAANPESPSQSALKIIETQRKQIRELRSEYTKLRGALFRDKIADTAVESPLALLLASLKDKVSTIYNMDTGEFLEWLEAASPPEISEYAGQGEKTDKAILADSLDELDGFLLSVIQEIDSLDGTEISAADTEAFLVSLWAKTFSSFAAVQEDWLETAFIKRGKAVVATVYPDSEERERLYHYGFPPYLGRRFEMIFTPLKAILESATEYGGMSESERLNTFLALGALMENDRGFGFQVRDTVTDKRLLENWNVVLGWWMNQEGSEKPEPKRLRSWQRFVTDNLEFKLGVGVGAVVARLWSEGVEDDFTAPSLEDWKKTTGLPWFGFWARELLRWGTLDPFVAFCLAQGLSKTRESAAVRRTEFDAWLAELGTELTPDDFIDPQLFLKWQNSIPRSDTVEDFSQSFVATLTGTNGEKTPYHVVPIKKHDKIIWLDAAGFEIASSEIPANGTRGLTQKSDYQLFADPANGVAEVRRVFDGRR